MIGLSTSGSISLGCALVAGKKRVPSPAAGKMAVRTVGGISFSVNEGWDVRNRCLGRGSTT